MQPRNIVGGVGELSFHLETRIGETHSLFIIRRLLMSSMYIPLPVLEEPLLSPPLMGEEIPENSIRPRCCLNQELGLSTHTNILRKEDSV